MSSNNSRILFLGKDREIKFVHEDSGLRVPDVGEGEVLVRVRLAAICEQVLDLAREDSHQSHSQSVCPCVPGREAVVEVVTSKRTSGDLQPGQRVVFSVLDTCGNCRQCAAGLGQYCSKKIKYGRRPVSADGRHQGCLSTYMLLGPGTTIVPLPEQITDRDAVSMATAVSNAVAAASLAPKDKDEPILIQGTTLVGLYTCAYLKHSGHKRIFCFDLDRNRVMRAAPFGGIVVHPDLPSYGELPEENNVSMVIDSTCTPESLKGSLYFLRPGGIYVLVGSGGSNPKVSIPGRFIIEKGLHVKGISDPCPSDLERALEYIVKTHSQFQFGNLFSTREFPFQDFPSALEESKSGDNFRVLVKP